MGIPDTVSLATVRMREILDRKNVSIVTLWAREGPCKGAGKLSMATVSECDPGMIQDS